MAIPIEYTLSEKNPWNGDGMAGLVKLSHPLPAAGTARRLARV